MQKIEEFGELMLGTRLKRLSDRMYKDLDSLYKARGLHISSRCFAPLIIIIANRAMGTNDLAESLGQSHASVSQVSKMLKSEGLISDTKHEGDERRRVLKPTAKGKKLAQELKVLWGDIEASLTESINESGEDLMRSLAAFERQLDVKSLKHRIVYREKRRAITSLEIIPYEPRYREHFKLLNVEWLERYFCVEAIDEKVLSQPEQLIIAPGGFIFFARLNDTIVGTAALLKDNTGVYELTKMSVTEAYQGLGIGERLANAAIDKFIELKGEELYLESNSRLRPALHLYEKLGFAHQDKPRCDSPYQRADVYMIYKK